jgi:hypothetical protein
MSYEEEDTCVCMHLCRASVRVCACVYHNCNEISVVIGPNGSIAGYERNLGFRHRIQKMHRRLPEG